MCVGEERGKGVGEDLEKSTGCSDRIHSYYSISVSHNNIYLYAINKLVYNKVLSIIVSITRL